jgi:thiamine biosynthesis protein ThiS
MNIIINGEKKEISANTTVSALLSELKIDHRKIALERNLQLIPRTTFDNACLNDGDEIEIINFVGGG